MRFRVLSALVCAASCLPQISHLGVPEPIGPISGRVSLVVTIPGELSQATEDSFRRTYSTTKNLGISASTLYYMWSELESETGQYTWESLDFPMRMLAEAQLEVSFILKIIDTGQLGTYPKDVKLTRFDDPRFVERLVKVTDALLSRYPNQISHLWIGNEIDDYLFMHRDEIQAYKTLIETVRSKAHDKYPSVKIGTISTYHDAKNQNALDVIEQIGPATDIIGFSLYPQTIPEATPTSTETYIKDIIGLAGRIQRPFLITECGWSAVGFGGSEARQVEFVHDLFRVYRLYKQHIETLGLFVLYDFPTSVTRDLAQQSGILGQSEFVQYIGSLGYAKNDGTPRPAWGALQEELRGLKR